MYKEMYERIRKANERNRRNLDVTMEEFSKKLDEEANGKPMTVTRYNDSFVMRADGSLEKVSSAD